MKFTYQTEARPVDGYTIRRGIHRGGFGEVYYAVSDAGKEVALKLLTHDLDTELRGIRQCLNLKHPNLVTLFDVKTDGDGDRWVVMEYVHGSSLDDVLAAFPNGLPLDEARDWLLGICAGVEYLHDRGIVHRDLKPANVYRENGVVKIGDVGLSKRMGGSPRSQHTESVGTVYYMAPEVAQGKYGPGVDLYSLGVMAYEMITGRLPFDGETTGEILMKHLTQSPDLKPLPMALRSIIARALEKDPQKRYAKVRDFADELRGALSHARNSAVKVSTATTLPESAFIPPPLRRDTDRTHDTSRRNGTRAAARPAQVTRKVNSSRCTAPWWGGWIPWVAVAAVFFVPWSRMAWNEMAMMAAVASLWGVGLYGLAWWCTPLEARWPFRVTGLTSSAGSKLAFSEQLSGSILVGSMAAAGLMLASLMALSFFEPQWVRPLAANATIQLMAVSILGAAAVLTVSQVSHLGQRVFQTKLWSAALGSAIGAAAYAFDEFLMVDFPDLPSHSAFTQVGAHPLWQNAQPTLVAYLVVFALMFGLQNWRKLLDPFRSQRLRLGAVAAAGGIGWMVSLLFGLPRPCAVMWAVTITAAAQLAAPWEPSRVEKTA